MAGSDRDQESWVSGVVVLSVTAHPDRIAVDIFGGDSGVVGSIEYRPDRRTFHDTLMTLVYWQEHQTPLTYLCRRGVASLRDERAIFEEAWGTESSGPGA